MLRGNAGIAARGRRVGAAGGPIAVVLPAIDDAVVVLVELGHEDARAIHEQPRVGLAVVIAVVSDTFELPRLLVVAGLDLGVTRGLAGLLAAN